MVADGDIPNILLDAGLGFNIDTIDGLAICQVNGRADGQCVEGDSCLEDVGLINHSDVGVQVDPVERGRLEVVLDDQRVHAQRHVEGLRGAEDEQGVRGVRVDVAGHDVVHGDVSVEGGGAGDRQEQ